MKHPDLRTSFLYLVIILVLAGWAVTTDGLLAQENETTQDSSGIVEEVLVTGSRIKRVDFEGPAPVVRIDRAELENAAVYTLEEFVRDLPLNWAPLSDALGLGQDKEVGYAAIDLRGIGTDATLTLVNGRRIAPFARYKGGAVDVNAIPVTAIERVEILKDGASAIYGAEAIAGVVNIILRTEYDGMEVSAGYGVTEHGDNEEITADFVTGGDYHSGSYLFALSWYDRDNVLARERDWAASADYSDIGGPKRGSGYGSPGTLLRYDNFLWEADPECGADPTSWIGDSPWGAGWGTACRFNYLHYSGLITGIERIGATFSGRYEIREDLLLFGDVLYSDKESGNNMAPSPVLASPQPLVETWLGLPYIPADHPNNPFGTDGEMRIRPVDMGNRTFTNESTAWRGVVGLEGAWNGWDWQLAGFFAKNEFSDHYLNAVSQSRLQLALVGQGGPGGDLYYNPFGHAPQNDPAVLDWIRTSARDKHTSQVHGVDVEFSRFFGELAGGPIGVAAGLEYRGQELDQWFDEQSMSGDLGGRFISGGAGPVSADRSVGSAFVEFSLPVHETVEAQLAGRYDHYDDFGSTTNPKVALRWQPNASLMFRGSYSTSFSPPEFGELFEPEVLGINWFRDAVRCEYTGADEDCDRREVPTYTSGNPGLEPEEGTSWFAGVVWEPAFAEGLTVQLDWWKFEHENRIVWRDPQLVLNEGGDSGIIREPPEPDGTPGRIIEVHGSYVNAERLVTEGFDTTLRYRWETARAGDFETSLVHTYTGKYQFTDTDDEWIQQHGNFAGWWAWVPVPRNRCNLHLSWDKGPHAAAANVQYTGHYRNFEYVWVDGEETDDMFTVSSQTTLDLQYSYDFEKWLNAKLKIGCINCTGEEPPLTYFAEPDAYHDPRGRVYYIRWQLSFG